MKQKIETIAKPQILTTKEVASLFRLKEITILRLARKGIIGFKAGKQWRFKRGQVMEHFLGDAHEDL